MKLIELIRKDVDLNTLLMRECDICFYKQNQDIAMSENGEVYSMSAKAFAVDGSGGEFVILEDGSVGLISSEGSVGRVVENVKELMVFLLHAGNIFDFTWCLGDAKHVFFNEFIEEYSQKFKYRVNCVIKERIPYEFQLELLTELTSKFNKNFDEIRFKSKMKDIYNSMGATYLYTLLYKFSKSKGVDVVVCILNQSNQWDLDGKSEFLNTVSINEDKSSFELNLNDNRVGFIYSEAKDIIALLLKGYKVAEIADELYDKYKNDKKYLKYKKAAFICSILDTCSKLEQLGVIRQVEVI